MASWSLAALHVLVFTAWGVSGLVAVLLAPHNRAARRLAVAGGLLVATRLLDHLLVDHAGTSRAWRDAWAPRLLSEVVFLAALAALAAALAVFPDGRYDRRGDRVVVTVLAGLTGVFGAARLVGSAEIRTMTDGDAGAVNPHASEALGWLDGVADVVFATEPGWILVGIVLLVVRHLRGDAERRAQLRWPLRALALLAAALVVVVVGNATGVLGDHPLLEAGFLLSLATFPLALLASVVARTRDLEHRLAASRVRLVQAEDAVRRQVERDLHDGVQQQLTALRSLVELARRQAARDPERTSATLADIADGTDEAMRDLRRIVSGIHPSVLTDSGLAAALAARLRRLPLNASLVTDEETSAMRWDPAVEGAAYFAVCEALTNTGKHAGATSVDVEVTATPDGLHLRVTDDGTGYAAADTTERGLVGVRDRVESLGGSLDVVSGRGRGTSVQVWLPGGRR